MVQTSLNAQNWLHAEFDILSKNNVFEKEIPRHITENLHWELRPYQVEAFARFFHYLDKYPEKNLPTNLFYNMATGSGKTLVMAGLILDLYKRGYRNFLFFVNSSNIIEKTKDNFLNSLSNKYLFNKDKITIDNKIVKINQVDNFEGINKEEINICFTTIQGLHSLLTIDRENSLTYEDFKDKKIAIFSDESHHINAWTRNKLNKDESIAKTTWEHTVNNIFQANQENIMLEFTATMDFDSKEIAKKYEDKIIYKYDLKQFRNDGYSKDVKILRSDTDKKGRILIALLLNQYRQDIAGKLGIKLKPVILFKAQRTIAQSEENKALFHKIIEELSEKDIEIIKKKTNINEIQRIFKFYSENNISTKILIEKLKLNFAENKCLSVNEEKEVENYQKLLNELENEDNQIRAIFAVQKLNEGWDVLNLFDIVRVYEGQAGGGGYKGKTSPSTISEAQLIGRGARYFPFKIKEYDEDQFKRKFDEDLTNDLRILEELHFHSLNESRYIAELNQELVNQGIMDDKTVKKELKLKENFKKSKFYRDGVIFVNQKIKNDYSNVNSFSDLGINEKDFKQEIYSYKGKITEALKEEKYDNYYIAKESTTIKAKEIDYHIFKNALSKKEFCKFENLKRYFPKLKSVNEIIEKKEYLGDIKINFEGTEDDLYALSNKQKFIAILKILNEIEGKLKDNLVDFKGTKEFNSKRIKDIFIDKTLKIEEGSQKEKGQEAFLEDKDWYVFNANYGTDEEKACVEFIDRLIKEDFKNSYKEIYFIRNELHFVIYNFDDGQAFAPDFVLFMKDKNKKEIVYQIFIEPKGPHLIKQDKWKEDFLIKIKEEFDTNDLMKFIETKKYKVIGVPFFNKSDENKFKDELLEVLND